jgi:NADPH2:quinone reductase
LEKAPLFKIPAGMSFEQASTLYITAPTCYLALFERGNLKTGETVLVHAGAGG